MSLDVFGIVGTVQAGQFEVESAVAEGGFAVVYRALHHAFRAPVALKCLKIPGAMTEEQRTSFLERFRAEAELLFRLSSITPNVVRPLQVGMIDAPGRFVPFIALEWLEGESLESVRERRRAKGRPPLSFDKQVKLLQPVARALSIAHQLPTADGPLAVIHCDLKPDNLFLAKTPAGDVLKVLDFGIARVKDVTSAIAGKSSGGGKSASAFTPGYGAPEQWAPDQFGQAGPWTDVWGLAITMVELALGRSVIEGALGTMMAATVDPARRPTPRTLGIDVPDALEEAMRRALAVSPRDRTQDVRTFWTAVEVSLGLPASLPVHEVFEPALSDPPPSFGPRLPPLAPPARVPDLGSDLYALDALVADPARHPPAPSWSSPSAPTVPASEDDGLWPPAVRRPEDIDPELAKGLVASIPMRPRPLPQPAYAPLHTLVGRPAEASLLERLSTPLKLVGVGLLVAIADQVYAHQTGSRLELGPLRSFWISAGLVLAAVVLGFVRLMAS